MQAEIGSISSGTMQPRDLIPVFADELRRLDDDGSYTYATLVAECDCLTGEDYESNDDDTTDRIGFILEELFDALDSFCPPYVGFGSHEGDGADFGFWPSIDALEGDARYEDSVVKVNDHSEIPKGWTGYVMLVNDHGNVTLLEPVIEYREVWAVV